MTDPIAVPDWLVIIVPLALAWIACVGIGIGYVWAGGMIPHRHRTPTAVRRIP